jgi:hypothetical protein
MPKYRHTIRLVVNVAFTPRLRELSEVCEIMYSRRITILVQLVLDLAAPPIRILYGCTTVPVRIPYTSVVSTNPIRVLPYRYKGTRTAMQYCQQPAAEMKSVWLLTSLQALPAVTAAAASQPAAAAAAPPPSPFKCWPPTLAPSGDQFVKAGTASARQSHATHVDGNGPQTAR